MPTLTQLVDKTLAAADKQQAYCDSILFHSYPTEFDKLRALAAAYRGHKITKHQFTHGIFWMFADDGGMDWCDDSRSLNNLARLICSDKCKRRAK